MFMIKKIFQVDAFTNKIFGGNPAGVVLDAQDLNSNQMQKIAREMNLSETAFVINSNSKNYDYEIKFYTPTEEVELCGHATIGAFYVMAKKGIIKQKKDSIKVWQKTMAGILPVDIIFNNDDVSMVMMTQSKPQYIKTINNLEDLSRIMNIYIEDIGLEDIKESNPLPMIYSTGLPDIMLPIKNENVLKTIKPNFEMLSEYSKKNNVVGIHAFTMKKGYKESIICRNFAPAYGINEESATGTSNGALSIYLIDNKLIELENQELELTIRQGQYMDRPSYINVLVNKSYDGYKVKVGGKAAIVFEGNIYL